jgi:hypothetical protein
LYSGSVGCCARCWRNCRAQKRAEECVTALLFKSLRIRRALASFFGGRMRCVSGKSSREPPEPPCTQRAESRIVWGRCADACRGSQLPVMKIKVICVACIVAFCCNRWSNSTDCFSRFVEPRGGSAQFTHNCGSHGTSRLARVFGDPKCLL